MNNCIMQCGTKLVGRQQLFCSDKCRKQYKRGQIADAAKAIADKHGQVSDLAKLGQSAPSTQTQDAQEAAESTISKQRVVERVDDPMYAKAAKKIDHFMKGDETAYIDQPDISLLPPGVSKPTGQRTTETMAMTSRRLRSGVRSWPAIDWLSSPEYAEVVYRLLTLSIEQLDKQGQFVPAWRLRQEPAQPAPVDEAEVEV